MINYQKFWQAAFVFFIAATFASQVNAQRPIPEGYELVWSEEFDVDGPVNPNIWKFEKGFVRNKEWQWYQQDNAWCEGGYLIIEGRRERKPNPNYDPNYPSGKNNSWKKRRQYINYTSSSIKTAGKKSWKYGIFEIRAKIPAKKGMWPAIWTLGRSGEWPRNGECDIMEYYGGKILANFAWGKAERWKAKWDGASKKVSSFSDPDWKNKFHTWRLEWTEQKMKIYVDNVWLNSVNLSKTINPHDGSNPFKQPHYLLLNLAIGSNGGDASKTSFPQRYLVDYVRVYQQTGIQADKKSTEELFGAEQLGIKVFPNPAQETVFVKGYPSSENLTIRIFNSNGLKVKESDKPEISIKELPEGLYFIRVNDLPPYKVIKK